MGLRFRKSINLGGFRINISKSGIGYSFGVPGLRFTKKAKGGYRTTASIPGTGLSYVKDSKKTIGSKTSNSYSATYQKQAIDNEYLEEIISNENEFVDTLNTASSKNRLFHTLFIMSIVGILIGISLLASGIQNLVIGLIIIGAIFAVFGAIALIIIPKNAKVKYDVKFDNNEQSKLYDLFIESFKILNSNYEYYYEYEGKILNPQNISLKDDPLNKILDGEFDTCCIYLPNCFLYFLPNIIIIFQDKVWKGIDYNKIKVDKINIEKTFNNFVPNLIDTEVLYTTYKYLNKDGTPNRRYTKENNPELYICAYAKIKMISNSGLKLDLISSNRQKSLSFTLAAEEFIKSFTI